MNKKKKCFLKAICICGLKITKKKKKKKKVKGKKKRTLQGLGSLVSKSPRTFLSAVIGAFSATVSMASFDTSVAAISHSLISLKLYE
jgi:hypothetical protein